VKLGQRSLGAVHPALQRAADADVGQPAHRLRGAITDPLAESDRATTLRTGGERGEPLVRALPAVLKLSPDGVEVQLAIAGGQGHLQVVAHAGVSLVRLRRSTDREPWWNDSSAVEGLVPDEVPIPICHGVTSAVAWR
jgi:hypothetical protein